MADLLFPSPSYPSFSDPFEFGFLFAMNQYLQTGVEAKASLVVAETDLASVISRDSSDAFPRVFATARMVALMEIAAARGLKPILVDDELSVGVAIDVSHDAATPIGATVTAHARYLGREGKLYRFEVWAEDAGGAIGRGSHKRAVVSTARLLNAAQRRNRDAF